MSLGNSDGKSRRKEHHLKDQHIGGRIILTWMSRDKGWGGMDWIDPVQDRDKWMVLVDTVMNLRFP
jgi:hypothetical protein